MSLNYTPLDSIDEETIDEDDGLNPTAISSSHKESEPMGKSLTIEAGDAKQEEKTETNAEEVSAQQSKEETMEISDDLKKIGLQVVDPVKFPTIDNVKLPISDENVMKWEKAPITSPRRWMSTLGIYILTRAHLALRIVHGHVVRVFRR